MKFKNNIILILGYNIRGFTKFYYYKNIYILLIKVFRFYIYSKHIIIFMGIYNSKTESTLPQPNFLSLILEEIKELYKQSDEETKEYIDELQ